VVIHSATAARDASMRSQLEQQLAINLFVAHDNEELMFGELDAVISCGSSDA